MPIYEYKCEICGLKFEKMQSFTDEPIRVCPLCGGSVKKLISRSSFILKGTGWYATDYAKKTGGGKEGSSGSSNACSSCTSKSCSSCSPR